MLIIYMPKYNCGRTNPSTCGSLVSFHFHRSWPQDDLGAVERTRTVASGEAVGNENGPDTFRALIWQRDAKRAKRSVAESEKKDNRSSNIDKLARSKPDCLSPIYSRVRVLVVSSSSLVSDSFGTCSPANVTLGCLVDGVFCAVERHNDTGQKLSMLRMRRIGFHTCVQSL